MNRNIVLTSIGFLLFLLLMVLVLPGAISHGCALGSRVVEIPMAIAVLSAAMWFYWARVKPRSRFIKSSICLVSSLCITLLYFTWLHSNRFPESLLDNESIEWKTRIERIKNIVEDKPNQQKTVNKQRQHRPSGETH